MPGPVVTTRFQANDPGPGRLVVSRARSIWVTMKHIRLIRVELLRLRRRSSYAEVASELSKRKPAIQVRDIALLGATQTALGIRKTAPVRYCLVGRVAGG